MRGRSRAAVLAGVPALAIATAWVDSTRMAAAEPHRKQYAEAQLDIWPPRANTPSKVDGTVHCLRNDLSQTVPATWPEHRALGENRSTRSSPS